MRAKEKKTGEENKQSETRSEAGSRPELGLGLGPGPGPGPGPSARAARQDCPGPARARWRTGAGSEEERRDWTWTYMAMDRAAEVAARELPARLLRAAVEAEQRFTRVLADTVELDDNGQGNAMNVLMILTMSMLGVVVLAFACCSAG
ncbi:Hypothetical Protein FCC1311_107452 [Hondaea fermentalgiana]|uniref:Uncharacterized protein n=1 Tax=Hondaea fermentalgiana TaxID=2315210 RepID=A0A2R5H159_9STRA|nr:Hypothetical Protein FCC1311_107452 [Hondaea fermentalgiana]|eukprot:GBG34521.1 Hypothetical Protein FCC1311_107452 [Hondaea fermentalgiana]